MPYPHIRTSGPSGVPSKVRAPRTWTTLATAGLLAALLSACAVVAPPQAVRDTGAVIAPNANLLVQGIPPIPASLAAQVDKYTDFRGHSFVTWHPTKPEMIVAHRAPGSSVNHLFRLTRPMGPLEPLTQGPEPVSSAHYEPKEGRFLIYARATGGNEVSQLYRLDLSTRQSTLLTNPDVLADYVNEFFGPEGPYPTELPQDRLAAEVAANERRFAPAAPTYQRPQMEMPAPDVQASNGGGDDFWATFSAISERNPAAAWQMLSQASPEALRSKVLVSEG